MQLNEKLLGSAILLLIPLVSALIGWLTNYLAVKMIFRPLRPRRILGVKIIGLIPKRKADLARKIGETVEAELVSHADIQKALQDPGFHRSLVDILNNKIDEFLQNAFGNNPLVAMFLTGEIAFQVRERLSAEIENLLPEILEMVLGNLENRIDFKDLVQKKIEAFELARLEQIIYAIASRELKAIEVLGGVVGFLIGCVQALIIFTGKVYG